MIKVKELKGLESYWAFQAYHTLMLGLKMLPSYMTESYEDFYSRVQEMPPEDQRKLIHEAAIFVQLQKEEVEAIVSFCTDKNGVPYSKINMKNMKPDQYIEMIVAVCVEISKIEVNFVTDAEKKKSQTSQSI